MLYSADRGIASIVARYIASLPYPISNRSTRNRVARLPLYGAMLSTLATGAHAATIEDAVEQYRPYMIEEVGQALSGAKLLQIRIGAKDLAGAKKAWIAARIGWERAEVFTSGFVAELDEQIDAWPNGLTGFHAIEAKLFGANSTEVGEEAKILIYHLTDLDIKIHHMPLNAQGMLNGTARLAYEVGESKADGGESRYSGTSLDDMRNNVAGIELAYKVIFASALKVADPKLAETIQKTIQQLASMLKTDLNGMEPGKVRAKSEELVLALQTAAPKIGLRMPTLEDLVQ